MNKLWLATVVVLAASPLPAQRTRVGGVFPDSAVMAPGVGSRSEAGIGALIPWADVLWAIGYVAHGEGEGIGLYAIDGSLRAQRRGEPVTGTYANRMVHWESDQVFIGPYAIDADGNVRILHRLKGHRLAATMRHLIEPESMVYFLTMEGLFFEADVETLAVKQLYDLTKELPIGSGQPHFKSGHTAQGRVIVANNTYEEPEFLDERRSGCLAEWNGSTWTVIERNPFVEVAGKQNPEVGKRYGNTVFATGWDRSSVILRVLHDGEWTRYLLPKASHSFDHTWNTEWMRIREAQTERYLMDVHGMFYELPALIYEGKLWGVRPIASHLRIVPDFCFYRGLFVMAGNQTDNAVGQPQSGLWFGDIDDLWHMGKPSGWGGPWWDTKVEAGEVSDPFLMTGFDEKVLHLSAEEMDETAVFDLEVDFRGDGSWHVYEQLRLSPSTSYVAFPFPDGFSAHWARIRAHHECEATAYFMYN